MSRPTLFQRVSRKLDKTVAAWFSIDQWVILTARGAGYRALDWQAFSPLIPPKDRYWGDPFPWQRGDCRCIFVEEKLYATGLGRIACLTIDSAGALQSQEVVLERPYHLSYPFLFEDEGELYMLPESAANGTVELYRCVRFPDRWEFVKNLLTGIYAVDATLLKREGRYWLFANVKTAGGSSLDSLHLFSSADLLAGGWQPHPGNPIVQDIRRARPAGRIFMEEGNLIRPAQDCSRRYGYALQFNRITILTETEYREEPAGTFTPKGSKYLATHTFNRDGELTVIDAVLRRRK
jgi:hypothetical protein